MAKQRKVDLSKDKTAPIAKQYESYINKSLQKQIAEINIPVLTIMKKSINCETYFLNHQDYHAIMGKNVELLDRMVLHSICEILANDIKAGIDSANGFVGVWDIHTIYNITAAVITIMKHDTTEELYLTSQQFSQISQEDLEKLALNTYMPYSEYNPNRLTQVIVAIRNKVLDSVANLMGTGIPNIFMSPGNKNTDLLEYLSRSFSTVMKEKLQDEDPETLKEKLTVKPTEMEILNFNSKFEKSVIETLVSFLSRSGLSDNVLNLLLGTSRLHIFYDDFKDESKKTLGDIALSFTLRTEDKRFEVMSTSFNVIIKDLYEVIFQYDEMSNSKKTKFGRSIRTAILNFTTLAINNYFAIISANKKENGEEVPTEFINNEEPTEEPDGLEDVLDSIE